MKNILIIAAIVILTAAGGYFFYQNQGLESQITTLRDEKAGVEKELAVLKSTDLAKENEVLKLKLESREKELASEKGKAQGLESDLGEAQDNVKGLESKVSRATLYFAVLGAFYDWEYQSSPFPILDRNTSAIDSAIVTLKDSEISSLWSSIKANFPRDKETGNFRYGEVLNLVNIKIANLLKEI